MANGKRAKMQNFTGSCLRHPVTHKSKRATLRTFNCHCEDCRKCSRAPYLTNIFVKEACFDTYGSLKSYIRQSESSNRITKKLREKCGCQMFSFNEGRPGLVRIQAGMVNELEMIKPQGDIWLSKKIPSIKMDETLDQFEMNFT